MCGTPTITTTTTNNNNNFFNVSKMALTKVHSHPYTDKCSGQTQKKKKCRERESHTYLQKGENEMLMGLTTLPFEVIASSVLASFCLLL
jgi:hypothetical protein